jgi:hypothetical protein
MSETTKTELETLQEEIAVLKAKKELNRERRREDPTLNRDSSCEDLRQVKSSRVRAWAVATGHILLAPLASVVYCTKTEKWTPFFVGTGMAVVGIPLAVIDMGVTSGILAPITSAAMIINQVKDDRRRQGFIGPEEADVAYFSRSF